MLRPCARSLALTCFLADFLRAEEKLVFFLLAETAASIVVNRAIKWPR